MALSAQLSVGALARDLVLIDWRGRRPRIRFWLWSCVMAVYAVWRSASLVGGPLLPTRYAAREALKDNHAVVSLTSAINEVWCGKPALVSTTNPLGVRLVREPSLLSEPSRTLIRRAAGSIQAYCETVVTPFLNNENSLATLETLVLSIGGRSMTPMTVARALLVLRLALVLVFCTAVLAAGGSVLMAVACFEISLALCRLTLTWAISLYPFIFVTPLLTVAIYVWLFRRADTGSRGGDWILLAAAGLAASFGSNMRTSHLPAYVALFAVFLWLWPRGGWRRGVLATVTVVAGYLAGHQIIVNHRQPPVVNNNNYSYHAVAHPLVLSLAIPNNSLARAEGISWEDGIGLDLARRVDASATYLGPSYEGALFRYYWSLWRTQPWAMAGIYMWKLDIAGQGMLTWLSDGGPVLRHALWVWRLLGSGLIQIWAMAALLASTAFAYRRRPRTFVALVAMLTAAGLMLQLEMASILSVFVLKYNAFVAFFAAMLGILVVQVALDAGIARVAGEPGAADAY